MTEEVGTPQRRAMDAVLAALPSAMISIIGVTVSVSFFAGNAKTDLNNFASKQEVMGRQITTLVEGVTELDKNQAVITHQITTMSQDINRINQGWTSLNKDMACIRLVIASKDGDITKC